MYDGAQQDDGLFDVSQAMGTSKQRAREMTGQLRSFLHEYAGRAADLFRAWDDNSDGRSAHTRCAACTRAAALEVLLTSRMRTLCAHSPRVAHTGGHRLVRPKP
jgi:hypothetical protein